MNKFIYNPNGIVTEIPNTLPLLDDVVNYYSNICMRDVYLVAVQHLQASTYALFSKINQLGLAYSDMFIIGKSYSTNPDVFFKLMDNGAYVDASSIKTDFKILSLDYKSYLIARIKATVMILINHMNKNKEKPLLILDDGGLLIKTIKENKLLTSNVIMAIEQTRSGARLVNKINKHSFPIINVAESALKLKCESPYIAEAVVRSATLKFNSLTKFINQNQAIGNVLVIGYGAIGSNIAKVLLSKKKFNVMVYDQCKSSRLAALKEGFQVFSIEKSIEKANIIIGCVGNSWINKNISNLIKNNSILMSTSSSNLEFLGLDITNTQLIESKYLRELFPDLHKIHGDYKITLSSGKNCFLLNGGFPINFDGSLEDVPLLKVQLTQALMLAGILQVFREKKAGFITLDANVQKYIKSKYILYLT